MSLVGVSLFDEPSLNVISGWVWEHEHVLLSNLDVSISQNTETESVHALS